jgi:hypothetical protein
VENKPHHHDGAGDQRGGRRRQPGRCGLSADAWQLRTVDAAGLEPDRCLHGTTAGAHIRGHSVHADRCAHCRPNRPEPGTHGKTNRTNCCAHCAAQQAAVQCAEQNAFGCAHGAHSAAQQAAVQGAEQSAFGCAHGAADEQAHAAANVEAIQGAVQGSEQSAFGCAHSAAQQAAVQGAEQSAFGCAHSAAQQAAVQGAEQSAFGCAHGAHGAAVEQSHVAANVEAIQAAVQGSEQSAFGCAHGAAVEQAHVAANVEAVQGAVQGSEQSAFGCAHGAAQQAAVQGSEQSAFGCAVERTYVAANTAAFQSALCGAERSANGIANGSSNNCNAYERGAVSCTDRTYRVEIAYAVPDSHADRSAGRRNQQHWAAGLRWLRRDVRVHRWLMARRQIPQDGSHRRRRHRQQAFPGPQIGLVSLCLLVGGPRAAIASLSLLSVIRCSTAARLISAPQ